MSNEALESDIERRAKQQALMMSIASRIDTVEDLVQKHNEVLFVGNGKPSVKNELTRLSSSVRSLNKSVDEFKTITPLMRKMHDWMEEQIAEQKKSEEKKEKMWDKFKQDIFGNIFRLLIGLGIAGLGLKDFL